MPNVLVRELLPREIKPLEIQNLMSRLHDEKNRVLASRDRSYSSSTAAIAFVLTFGLAFPMPIYIAMILLAAATVTKRAIEEGTEYDAEVIDFTKKLAAQERLLSKLGLMRGLQMEETNFLKDVMEKGHARESFLTRMIHRYHELFKVYLVYSLAILIFKGGAIDFGITQLSGLYAYLLNVVVFMICLIPFLTMWSNTKSFTASREDPRIPCDGYVLAQGIWISAVFPLTRKENTFPDYDPISRERKKELSLPLVDHVLLLTESNAEDNSSNEEEITYYEIPSEELTLVGR